MDAFTFSQNNFRLLLFVNLFLDLFVNPSSSSEPDMNIHVDICWMRLEEDMCSEPLQGHRTTYTECCCLYGFAWSGQCAFCPRRDSGEKHVIGWLIFKKKRHVNKCA